MLEDENGANNAKERRNKTVVAMNFMKAQTRDGLGKQRFTSFSLYKDQIYISFVPGVYASQVSHIEAGSTCCGARV